MLPVDRLLLIYDADSSAWGAVVDSAKKLLKIQGCELCEITHGTFREKSEWRSCERQLGAPVQYLHRDELSDELREVATALPCIVAIVEGAPRLLLSREIIARCRGRVADLRGKLLFHASRQGLQLHTLPFASSVPEVS